MSFIKTHFKQLKLWLGAVGNGSIAQGSVTLTAHCNLTQADVGNPVWILGAGANHAPHRSHIVSVASATSCTIADASPFASPGYPSLGTAIVIVWRQRDYLPETLNCSLSLSTQSSLSFTVLGTVPHGCPVILGIDNANNLVFGGVVSRDRLTVVSNKQDIFTECECVSWQYALGRQFTDEKTYDNTTAGAVFQALLNNPRVAVDYVGYNVQDVGAFIESVAFGTENLWDALQRLVDLSNTPSDKFYIYVDPYRVAHFRKQTAIAAPWVLTKDGSILLNYNVIKTSEKRINRVVVKGSQVLGDTVSERFYGNGSARTFYTAASIGSEPIILRNGAPQTVGIYGIDTGRDWYWNSGSNALRQDPAGTVLTATDFLDVSYRGFQYQSAEAQNTTDQAEARAAEGGSGIYWHHVAVTTPTTAEGLQGLAQAWVTKYAGKAVQVDIDTYRSGLLPGQKITVQLDDAATSGEYLIESASIQVRRAYVVWSVRCTSALLGDWRKPFLDLTDLAGITPHSEQTAPPTIPGAPNILNATAEAYYTDQDWYEEESGRFLAFRGTITLPTALPNYAYLYQIRVYATSDAPGSSRREIAVIPRSQFTDVVIDWDTSKLEPRPKNDITYDLEFVADNGSAQTASPFMVQNVQVLGQPEAPDLPLSLTVMEAIAERFIDDAFVTHTVLYPTPVFATGTRAKRIRYYLSLNNGATYGFPGSPDGFLGEREVGDNKGLVLPVPSSDVPTARMKAITLNDYGTNDLSNAVVSSPFAIQGYLPLPSTTVQGAGATYSVDQNKSLWAFYPQVIASIPTRPAHFAKVELRLKLYNGSGQLSPDPRYAGKGLLLKEWTSEIGAITWTATLELPPPTEPANGYRRYRFEFWGITKAAQETLCTAWTGGATYGELYVSESWATPPPEPPALPVSITVTEAIAERRLDHQNNVKTFLDPVVTLPDDSGAEWLEFWLSLDNGVTYKFDGSPTGWLGERRTYESLRFEIYVPRGGSVTARMKVISHSTRGRNDIADAVVSPPFTIAGLGSVPETGVITNAEFSYTLDLDNVPWAFYPVVKWIANAVPPYHGTALTVKLYNAAGQLHPDPKYQGDGQETGWWTNIGEQVYDSNPLGWMLPQPDEPLDGYRYYRLYLWAVNGNYERTLALAWPGGASYGVMYVPESRRQDSPAVHPAAPNITAATAETYYADANGTQNVDGSHFGFRGTVTLPTAHADYSHLRAIQIFATHPDGHRELITILTEWEFGTATLTWKGIVRARPESDVIFPKIEFECVNDDTRVTPNPYTISNVTVIGRLGTSVPDVAVFHAGRSLGDGTFAPEAYTDELRTKMLVDWACVLPDNLGNWHGVAIWVRTPANHYVQVTNVLEFSAFKKSEGGSRYLYDTRAFTLDDIPDPPETWTFIAVSYNHLVEPNRDLQGNPRGRTVDLQTLPKGNHVLNFQVERVPGQQLDESGNQTWSYVCTWSKPPLPRYTAIRIMQEGWFGPGEYQQMTGNIPREETKAVVGPHPMPPEPRTLKVYAQPVFGDNTVIPLAQCPFAEITISPHIGESGREHADRVTNLNAVVADPAYAVNGQGQKVLRINITWQRPSDVRYAGAQVWVIWYDGQHHQLTGTCTQNFFLWESGHFPSATQQATFYLLSVDKSGRSNDYVPGVTPSKTINIPPPPLGPSGQEYTSNVPSGGYTALVSYPSTADGTYNAVITAYFTAPNDITWGGVELVLRYGTTEKPMLRTNASPAVLTVPVPDTGQSWSLYLVSYDVNGRRNSITTGTPMVSLFVGSAAGKLRLDKADPNSIELNQFTIINNKLRIFQIDGDLIVSGTISSSKLNATAINVGGGGSKPGKFAVYNAAGAQIGFIGVEDGVEGGWFKTLGIAGPNKSNPIISADGDEVSINGASFTLTVGTETVSIDRNNPQGVAAVEVSSTSIGSTTRQRSYRHEVWNVGYEYSRFSYLQTAAVVLRWDSRYVRLDATGPHGLYVDGNRVVGPRVGSAPTRTTKTAGTSYGSNEQDMLNELKAWQDAVHAALSAAGHGLWP